MGLSNTLIDNSENLKLIDTINEIIAEPKINEICIATGYWDLKGTALITDTLLQFLEKNDAKVRILIGKDPIVFARDLKNDVYKNAKEYPKDFLKIDLANIDMNDEQCQKAAKMLIDYCSDENKKIEVKIFETNENDEKQFLHSKCYIFYGSGVAYGIIGSSNFTQKGLEGNSELNYLETLTQMITAKPDGINMAKGHIFWFNEKWKLAKDWTQEFIVQLQNSPIGKKVAQKKKAENKNIELTPYETYIKLLQSQFSEIIDFDSKIKVDDYLPKPKAHNFKTLNYQLEAVNQGCAIMKRHGGFILGDVVGLGKTYTALMVAKRHLLETGFASQILIVTPPAIKQSWIDSIDFFDEDEIESRKLLPHITLTTIGCLDDESESNEFVAEDDFDSNFKRADYSMIVVDESHRFRNNNTMMYQKLDDLIASIQPQPYVVLLSATPQNNRPYDLRNQIYLFEREHNNSTLQNLGNFGNKLESYFAEKQRNYETFIKKDKIVDGKKVPKSKPELEADRAKLKADSEDIRKRIVEPLVIRRTRTDIEKYYAQDMKSDNLSFPKIQPPVAIPYEMKGELGELFNNTINIIAPQVSHIDSDEDGNPMLDLNVVAGEDALGYFRYRAIEFLKNEDARKRHEKNNLTVKGTSERLAQIMEILLVKRLESSQAAFKESLHNLRKYTDDMIKMWNADRIFVCPDVDVKKELSAESIKKNGSFEACLDVIAKKAEKANEKHNSVNIEYKKSDFFDNYIEKLQNDLRLIDELCDKWDKQTGDPKMSAFIFKSASDFLNSERNPSKKLIIFTECIATQKALIQKFKEMPIADCNVLSITSENRNDMKDVIAANFDANYKGEKKDDYQILITTDVLAEGVNLHRANSIVNYDSPWNATRLMQRLGRINRIGSQAKEIWNYNFYPSTLGDNQINLKNRTYVKLQAFHELFGEDSQIYSTEEEVKHFDKVERESDEEMENPIMPFIAELREFRDKKKEDYERILAIKEKIITAVKAENAEFAEKKCAFVSLLQKKKETSLLYLVGEGGGAKSAGQLEFFETLKPFSALEKAEVDKTLAEKYKTCVLTCYESDKQNAMLSVRSKLKAGAKEIKEARDKLKALYDLDLSDEYFEKLDEVINSVNNKNTGLIHKVLKMQFETDGFAAMQVQSDIDYLYNSIKQSIENSDADIEIEFVVQ